MKNYVKKYSREAELSIIKADERLAAIARTGLALFEVQDGFYRLFEGADPVNHALVSAIEIERPFHHFLLDKTLPTDGLLASCPEYWVEVLSNFVRNFKFLDKMTRRKMAFPGRVSMASAAEIGQFAGWLQEIGSGFDDPIFPFIPKGRLVQFWKSERAASKFHRLYFQFSIKAMMLSPLRERHSALLWKKLEAAMPLASGSAAMNPLTLRNLAFAVARFWETVMPILEKRFPATELEWLVDFEGGQLFAHWAFRLHAKMAAAMGLDGFVHPELKAVLARQPYLWLPIFLVIWRLPEMSYRHAWAPTPFWDEVCQFFARNGAQITREEANPIIDFITQQKRERPGFSLAGRSAAALRRQMEAWHLELAQQRVVRHLPKTWPPVKVKNFRYETGEGSSVVIVQIVSQVDIIAEGRAMHHCVAAYAGGCVAKHHSIWSLRKVSGAATERLVTIQLSAQNQVVQGPAARPTGCRRRRKMGG